MVKYRQYFFLFIAAVTLFRLFYIGGGGPLGLIPDEAHYWEWSRRLDLSYYSKGPAIAWIIALSTAILGDTEFAVRIGAVLFSLVGSLLLYSLTKDIFKSERAALLSILILNLTPLYAVGSILMTTDAPFILAWGVTVYLFRRAVRGNGSPFWYLAGIAVGFGLLSKYIMGLIFPCMLLYLIMSRDDRHWLTRREPYIATLISLLVFSPVILWNIRNGWVTIRHTMGQAHVEAGLGFSLDSVLEFVGGQAGLITPLIFLGLLYAVVKCGVAGLGGFGGGAFAAGGAELSRRKRDYILLFCMSVPVLLFFLVKSGQGKVQGNWAAAGYITAFIATGGVWDNIYSRYERRRGLGKSAITVLFCGALLLSLVATTAVHYPRLLTMAGMKRVLQKAPYNRIVGWEGAGEAVGEVYREMERRNRSFIVGGTYQTASELAFYIPGHPTLYNIYLGNRRMNQYDIWPGFETLIGYDALYVKGGAGSIEGKVAAAFDECGREVVSIAERGEVVRTITLFKCRNFKGMEQREGDWSY
ncbi:MAG: glycosyltransferase family 39 protein [Deltaproteobacteria bacterium]|nr:glycosyltransferase family 39 protein [Deltaproteobacteria bacterium]